MKMKYMKMKVRAIKSDGSIFILNFISNFVPNFVSKKAFTLVEMVIAITVFTIFIGFVMSTYLSFHRAQQEAAVTRSLIMEAQSSFDFVIGALKENKIDYERYENRDASSADVLSGAVRNRFNFEGLYSSDMISTTDLYLLSSEGDSIEISWDEEDEVLSFIELSEEDSGNDSISLHSENVSASYVGFEIFPDVNPYDPENFSDDDVQFQPIVRVNLIMSAPGRVRDEVSVELQTSVSSRFYQ